MAVTSEIRNLLKSDSKSSLLNVEIMVFHVLSYMLDLSFFDLYFSYFGTPFVV